MRRLALAALAVLAATACSQSGAKSTSGPAETLRLGYFANVTHATPVVGVGDGTFAKHLGSTTLETQVFNAGPAAVEAIFAGSLDAAYLGPNPAINAYVKSHGAAIRIVAGATSGGASLVVRKGITSAAQLEGRTLASPQLGGTQDVALRAWLKQQGVTAEVAPSENATTLQLFQDGKIDGAWVPEPWASRLVLDGGGSVLVDERTLWPKGQFVTTHLVVATKFLEAHPETVRQLIEAQVETNAWINGHLADAKRVVNEQLLKLTSKQLSDAVIDRAFQQITVTNDPIRESLTVAAQHAVDAGLLAKPDLDGIYDLSILDDVLTGRN